MKKFSIYSLIASSIILCALVAMVFKGDATQAVIASEAKQSQEEIASPLAHRNNEGIQSQKPLYAIVGGQEQLTSFPNEDWVQKLTARNQLRDQGDNLASHGFYEEAIARYKEALDPSLLDEESDKSGGLWGIMRAHQHQGKFDLAIQDLEWFLKRNPTKTDYLNKRLELLSLLEWQNTGSPKPVYDHIRYLRERYKKYLPPKSYDAPLFTMVTSDIIHLYNAIGDVDGGIRFLDEMLRSKYLYPGERSEIERVRHAFLLDKQTGKKGHLKEVLKDSQYISW